MDVFTDKYEILTPHGFVDFDGIRKTEKCKGITLHFNDGSDFSCTPEHKLKINGSYINAINSLNCKLLTSNASKRIIKITKRNKKENFYDVLDVKNNDHSYYSSGIVSHNCQFIGSVSTLIDHNFLGTMKAKPPLKIPKLAEFIRIWDLPKKTAELEARNWEYIASLDSGYGMHADSTVMQIFLVKSNITAHQVAVMSSNKMDIDEFCKKANMLLKKFHSPNLIIEQNGPGIAATNFFHLKAEYENLLHFDPNGRHMGMWATDKLKDNACVLLKTYIQRKFLHIYDQETINELYSFGKVSQTKWGALGGNHDDHVTATYWIAYYLQSPLFYGTIVEVNIKSLAEDAVILTDEDEKDRENEVLNNMRDPRFHQEELEKGAKYLPEDYQNDVIKENNGDTGNIDDVEGSGLFFRT